MQHIRFLILALGLCSNAAAQSALEKQLQTQLIMASPGDTIRIPSGKHYFSNTLWLDGKSNVHLMGTGQGQCILSFARQKQGAEGIKITHAQRITLSDFTIEDSKGDLIKAQECDDIVFRQITAQWTGKPSKNNGAYALYPVQCRSVRIERCTAIGASDAGIYVGQSDSVWISGCYAKKNVAGIEIENTTHAWVWNNIAAYNTGGILVFDLPDLPKKAGGRVLVWKNKVVNNNHKNFAPRGNIVGKVPPGTGVMVMATKEVEITGNYLFDNRTASVAITSYYISENPLNDPAYDPCPQAVYIHGNVFSEGKRRPVLRSRLGLALCMKFGRNTPHILYDGIPCDTHSKAPVLCLGPNQNGSFANIRADQRLRGISRDPKPYRCQRTSMIPHDEAF